MVSFFGLKLSSRKKRGESKPDTKEPQAPKRIDQNTLGEGQFFGQNPKPSGVINGSIRSVPRAGTSQSGRSPYAMADTHNLAAASMFDLGNVPSIRAGTPNSLHLRSNASELNLRARLGENNGSVASLRMPAPAFASRPVSRPGSSSGKNKPWVNPLDVHFMRATPTPPPGSQSMKMPPTATKEPAGGELSLAKEADNIADAVINSVNRQEEQEKERREKEKEAEKQKETARLELERLERQKSTETILAPKPASQTQARSQSPTEPSSESKVESESPKTQGPIFRGDVDQRPDSRNGIRGNGPSPAIHQGPPPTGPPTQSLPQPPGQGPSRQGPHPPANAPAGPGNQNSRPQGPHDINAPHGRPGPGSGPGSHRPNGSQFNGHGPPRGPPNHGSLSHGPHPKGPPQGPPRQDSPSQRPPFGPPQGAPRHVSPSQRHGPHGPPSQGAPNGRGPHLRGPLPPGANPHNAGTYQPGPFWGFRPQGNAEIASPNPAPSGNGAPQYRPYRPNVQPQASPVDDVPETPATEQAPPEPLISSLTSPTASTSASTARSSVNEDFLDQLAPKAVIRDVSAKRDTSSALNMAHRHSLSMKIHELEQSLLAQHTAKAEEIPQPQSPEEEKRTSAASSYYSAVVSDDGDQDKPVLTIQPAPLRIPSPVGLPKVTTVAGPQSPLRETNDSQTSPSSLSNTPQLGNANWKRGPGQPTPALTADTSRPSPSVDTGFNFDFGLGPSTPMTPDSSNWPLSPTTENGPAAPQPGQAEPDAISFNRSNVPPPLKFNFSPDASSRDPTMSPGGLLTPPLGSAPPTIALNDGRPSTSSGFSSGSGLAASPSFFSQFAPEPTKEDLDAAASFMGIGMARGPSIREVRRPGTSSGQHHDPRMVDSLGAGFI